MTEIKGFEVHGGPLGFVASAEYRALIEKYGFDPFFIMPPNGRYFDLFATRSVAPAATEAIFEATIGANEFVRISGIGMEADSTDPSVVVMSDLIFRLRVNRNNLRHYGAMSDQIGTGQDPTGVFVRIFSPSAFLDFVVTNNHATDTSLSFGRVQGWTIPR